MKDYCKKCGEHIIQVQGDNEIAFDGDLIRISVWNGKTMKEMEPDDSPVLVEVGRIGIGMTLDEFKELCNAVAETKSVIEKRLQFS